MEFINEIRGAATKKILYTLHALDEMNAPHEMITTEEVRDVIFNGTIIEEYPDDNRGHSCLMLRITKKERAVHVVCAPKEEYLAIITAYIPSLDRWQEDFLTRRMK